MLYGVYRQGTARLDTQRLRRPMIDAPYEFDIDHPVMPLTPDIPHYWKLCVVRAESAVWSHCYIVWRLSVSIWFVTAYSSTGYVHRLLFIPNNKVLE